MNKIILTFLFGTIILGICTPNMSSAQNKRIKDTITYRALVWVEKSDIQWYGGQSEFRRKSLELFENITSFWNNSPNKFEYYFRFVPSGFKVYDNEGDPSNYKKNRDNAFDLIDTSKYDFSVFFALNAENDGLWAGTGKSGQAVIVDYKTRKGQKDNGDIFSKKPPEFGEYGNIAHEFGHFRGATDLYQYMISADDNPVNGKAFAPPKSIMRYAQDAVWDDYCSLLFNYTAYQRQLNKNLLQEVFPDVLRIKVLVNGRRKSKVPIKIYGSRAAGKNNNRDFYPNPYLTLTTNKKGIAEWQNVYRLFHPDRKADNSNLPPSDAFPYNYWFSFLIEAEYKGEKQYIWLPDWKSIISKLSGNNVEELIFSF